MLAAFSIYKRKPRRNLAGGFVGVQDFEVIKSKANATARPLSTAGMYVCPVSAVYTVPAVNRTALQNQR